MDNKKSRQSTRRDVNNLLRDASFLSMTVLSGVEGLPLKILMKIRYRFNAFIKISQLKFFVGAVQVIAV